MDAPTNPKIEASDNEDAALDFKAALDPTAAGDWCELIKDVVAMANSGGGVILFGVNDDGSASAGKLEQILALDPAVVADKIAKYTGQHFSGFAFSDGMRRGSPVVVLTISSAPIPIVFSAPGTYDIGGGKQKTAFGRGTVYFRHGAKSEPGTSEDLRAALERELDRVRSSWLDGIAKVVTAPVGATISVLPGEVQLTGAKGASAVRLVNDEALRLSRQCGPTSFTRIARKSWLHE
jgi:schlafen family protein